MKKYIEENQKKHLFPVVLQEEKEGGYFVVNPALEGCYSQGDTVEEALQNIKEATELCVEEIEEKELKDFVPTNVSLHLIEA